MTEMFYFKGVASKLDKIYSGSERTATAQVQKIWHTLSFSPLTTPNTFFAIHSHFAPASIILEPNVHLLSMDNQKVKLLRFDRDVDILNIRKYPILFLAQLQNARDIIIVPRRDFDRIIKKVEEEDRNVVWFFHTIRCGSTLWSQIFDSLPNWTVISEAQAMYHSIVYTRTDIDIQTLSKTQEYEELVVAVVKFFLMLAPKGHSVFWKTVPLDEYMVGVIRKRFPSHKILFGYRNVLPCAMSYHKAFGWITSVQRRLKYVVDDMENIPPTNGEARVGWLFNTAGFDPNQCVKAVKTAGLTFDTFEWFVLLWAIKVTLLQDSSLTGAKIKHVKYEHLLGNPKGVISDVFEYLDINSDLVEQALQAMKHDSQDGLFFSHKNRTGFRSWKRTDESVRRCNQVLRVFNLPDLDSDFSISAVL